MTSPLPQAPSKPARALELADQLKERYGATVPTSQAAAELRRLHALNLKLAGALRFILAFYEPGQTYLDTEAWKRAEAGGRAALAEAGG